MSAWKPGDVAIVNGARAVRADHVWHTTSGILSDHNVAHARPLVVIDPEDREQVERLSAAYADVQGYHPVNDLRHDAFQAALRSLIAPPKPPEPQGRYAVVEDKRAVEWVRAELIGTCQWHSIEGERSRWADWGHIDAERVVSEGVTP